MVTINPDDRFNDNLTPQQVFDLCAHHLGTMGERCFREGDPENFDGSGQCVYRKEDGNTCAVGYFFTDDEYKPQMDALGSVGQLIMLRMFPERLVKHEKLLQELQSVHDARQCWVDNRKLMREELCSIAWNYSLHSGIVKHPDMAWNKKDV